VDIAFSSREFIRRGAGREDLISSCTTPPVDTPGLIPHDPPHHPRSVQNPYSGREKQRNRWISPAAEPRLHIPSVRNPHMFAHLRHPVEDPLKYIAAITYT